MDLHATLAEQLDTARRIAASGATVIPAWRIATPEGEFLILTRFDETRPEQRERALHLITRFMAWKLATAFVMTGEGTHSDPDGHERDYLIGAAVSLTGGIGARQHVSRTAETSAAAVHTSVEFGPVETFDGLTSVDPALLALLPRGKTAVSFDEALLLSTVFDEGGQMPAHRIN